MSSGKGFSVRSRIARRGAKILHLGSLGGGKEAVVGSDAELLLGTKELLGGGLPDVLGRLCSTIALDIFSENLSPISLAML